MKRVVTLCSLIVLALIFVRATCGKVRPPIEKLVEVMKIKDHVYYHNISIAYNGEHYYTINGGNDNYCVINEYDRSGRYIKSYDVGLDGRALFYSPKDKQLYVKVFGTDIYKINLADESATMAFEYIFDMENGSPAVSPDGQYFYEFLDGEVTEFDAQTGQELRNFKVAAYYYEHGYNVSIAASEHYLFVWGDEDDIIVYDLDGNHVAEVKLPRLGFGFSLSYCNGLLWIAEDADAAEEGGDGFWYGYRF